MKLYDLILEINDETISSFVCARRPWTFESDAIIIPMPDDCRIPDEIKQSEFQYFLESTIIVEIKQDFSERPTKALIETIIYYAENDAFPL